MLALILVLALGRGIPVADQVTCDPTFPDAVTFTVEPSYPVWYDGDVTVRLRVMRGHALLVKVDQAIRGVILTGDHSQVAYRDTDGGRFRLPHDTIRSVMVCYGPLR